MNNLTITMIFMFAIAPCLSCFATGPAIDASEYEKRETRFIEFKRKSFERMGVVLAPERLLSLEQLEIIDSFLNGRDFYRNRRYRHCPMEDKMPWLKELFGEDFKGLEKKWRREVSNRNANRCTAWTRERIAARLDELAALENEPMPITAAMCRSSSGLTFVDVECIHCGHHTVYTHLDDVYHNQPPSHYKAVAKELERWGLDVDVDGRAACPDCSLEAKDFKLAETPTRCRVKPDVDLSSDPYLWCVRPDWDLIIMQSCARGDERMGYDVRCNVPEAWMCADKYGFLKIYERPGGRELVQISALGAVEVEPREEKVIQQGGEDKKFIKVKNLHEGGFLHIKTNLVEVVERKRSSGLDDIPNTFFIFKGFRFPVDEELAEQMLAFVQGYMMVVSGQFHDCSPIQKAIPRLRDVLVNSRIPKSL